MQILFEDTIIIFCRIFNDLISYSTNIHPPEIQFWTLENTFREKNEQALGNFSSSYDPRLSH